MSRVWLLGEHNPYGAHPKYALYPSPAGCAGWRLSKILGMSEDEYIAAFERRNLLAQDRWSAPLARRAAQALLCEVRDGDALVLLGARVSKAFGFDFAPCTVHDRLLNGEARVRYLVSPHPSGLSRQWNDPTMRLAVRDAVRALLDDRRGSGDRAGSDEHGPPVDGDLRALDDDERG